MRQLLLRGELCTAHPLDLGFCSWTTACTGHLGIARSRLVVPLSATPPAMGGAREGSGGQEPSSAGVGACPGGEAVVREQDRTLKGSGWPRFGVHWLKANASLGARVAAVWARASASA